LWEGDASSQRSSLQAEDASMLLVRARRSPLPGSVGGRTPPRQRQVHELAAALEAAESTNERLRGVIAVMRLEMEELHNATSARPLLHRAVYVHL
jgi:hypothetical protein